MIKRKYSKELLEPIIKKNVSVIGVMRDLGFKVFRGGSHTHLTKRIQDFGLDTSHFTGRASNRGVEHKGGPAKKTAVEILVFRTAGRRQKTYQLRRALLEVGRIYECDACHTGNFWNGKPLMLEVEHKNRLCLDDRANNLIFLCPNCHSQTNGHCGSKGLAEIASVAKLSRVYRKNRKGAVAERKTRCA